MEYGKEGERQWKKKNLAAISSATGRQGKNKVPQLNGAEKLLRGNAEKAKVLTATFASVVTSKNSPPEIPWTQCR